MARKPSILSRLERQARYLAGYLDLAAPEPTRRVAAFDGAVAPVLLLHGFLATRRTVEVLERRFRRDGYTVFSFRLGGVAQIFRRRVDHLAEHVAAKIERIYRRHPTMAPLTIVGHSQGGLVGAWYVKKLEGWRRVRALVTLGTPHHGTPAAWAALPLAAVAPAIWQMRPRSGFLRRLASGPWPAGVRLTSIWSRQDRLAPYPTAVLDTAGLSQVRNVEVDGEGHRDFLFRKRIYRAILAELRREDPVGPQWREAAAALDEDARQAG